MSGSICKACDGGGGVTEFTASVRGKKNIKLYVCVYDYSVFVKPEMTQEVFYVQFIHGSDAGADIVHCHTVSL